MNERDEKCSICGGPLAIGQELEIGWLNGNNAQPINDGQCCAECNRTVVLPERLKRAGWKVRTT